MPGIDQVLHQAVVAGQLDDLAAADPVGAAVARPEAAELAARDGQPDDGAADRRAPIAGQRDQLAIDLLERCDRASTKSSRP